MAVTLTSSRAIATTGRGRSKTVVLDVSFKELERWAKKMGLDERKLLSRAFGRAVSGLKAKFRKVISNAGGVEGVPKFRDFEEFTKTLRAATGRTAKMGGVLADKANIVGYKQNGWQIIGWPDRLAEWAVRFQDGVGGESSERYFTDPKYRAAWHRRLKLSDIPRAYVHNPRKVLPEPFGAYVRKNLDTWAQHTYYKDLARRMQKAAKGV